MRFLSSSLTWLGLIKNGDLSITSISISILGHIPISTLRLSASLYLYSMSITSFFSSLDSHDVSKSIYFSSICLSVIYFLSSLGCNHGYTENLSSPSYLMKSTAVYESLSTTTTRVLFQREYTYLLQETTE